MARGKYKATSRRVVSTHVSYLHDGTIRTQQSQRGPRQIAQAQAELKLRRGAVLQRSSAAEREILNEFGHAPAASDTLTTEQHWEPFDQEMDDSQEWETEEQHSGLQQVYTDLADGITEHHHHFIGRKCDVRTRRDRQERRNQAWAVLHPALVEAHLNYELYGSPSMEADAYHPPIRVVEWQQTRSVNFPLVEAESLNVTMARHGYIGTAPLHPSSAISTNVLEFFRVVTTRCPQLSLQAFTKTLCDLHCLAYSPTLRTQLSIAFDAYLNIYQDIQRRVNIELGRNGPRWRLKNACPACTYTLENELALDFRMLIAMDGNESVKRLEHAYREKDAAGKIIRSENTELSDSRTIVSDMYLSRESVDRFKNEVKRRADPPMEHDEAEVKPVQYEFVADSVEGRPTDGADKPTPCVQRWTNLADENTKKRLGIFDETGLFLTVCRHGTALVMCDMVKSGELAKYPLAVSDELIDAFGEDLLYGYDIGCGFDATANNSKLVGPKMRQCRARFCVGSFHGHAHCRLCQLDWHPMYIKGCGLEDFETCEHVFSRSNALAACTRHASIFHRRQLIHRWFETWNADKYAESSQFIYNNYVQALSNINTIPEQLSEAMRVLGIPSMATFETWRLEEKKYLQGLKHEPEDNILKMEYVETLIKLQAANDKWEQAIKVWQAADLSQLQGSAGYNSSQSGTRKAETARKRGLETILTLQKAVQDLETKLEIYDRWMPGCPEWDTTFQMIESRKYRRALDHLEGLVVARLFELTKAHQSGTAVKLRKQIAKALSARSQAIRTAIKNYNTAAAALKPPRPALDVQVVLNHVYLGQFDLLRDSRNQVLRMPWAQPAEREAGTAYFKLTRSHEELQRVNVEARRLRTFIEDEEADLLAHIQHLEADQPVIAFQIAKKRRLRVAVNSVHRRRLQALEQLDGFRGIAGPGVWKGLSSTRPLPRSGEGTPMASEEDLEGDSDGNSEDQHDNDDEVTEAFENTFSALSLAD